MVMVTVIRMVIVVAEVYSDGVNELPVTSTHVFWYSLFMLVELTILIEVTMYLPFH